MKATAMKTTILILTIFAAICYAGWEAQFYRNWTDESCHGNCVIQTNDGGYYSVGCAYDFESNRYQFAIKTDSFGSEDWRNTLGFGELYAVVQNSSDDFFLAGWESGIGQYIAKINRFGMITWEKNYNLGYFNDIIITSDSSIVVTGMQEVDSTGQMVITKLSFDGDTLWSRTYGWGTDCYGISIKETEDGGYAVLLFTLDAIKVVRTSYTGDVVWVGTIVEDPAGVFGQITNFDLCQDGGYIFTGTKSSYGSKIHLIKTSEFGDTLWERTYGRDFGSNVGSNVIQTCEGGFAITGSMGESYSQK